MEKTKEAKVLIEYLENIDSLKEKVKILSSEWSPPSPSVDTRLKVKLPDETLICENSGVDTFTKTLQSIGLDQVHELGIKVGNKPLLSKEKPKKGAFRKVDNWYIYVNTSTKQKKEKIDEISQKMGLSIDVKIISK